MRIDELSRDVVWVTLSRRNLVTLLANLEGKPSYTDCSLYRRQSTDSPVLVVHVEPDSVHYRDRDVGSMPPSVEAFIQEHADGRD
ncbi:MAG: hypothetical protein JOZ46_01365 [Candidatus Dormibacteraeota bacterium]|nr:hypothetical protein [Candidatus Dormibacteraeota bacterium]MBV9524443.1 hypothetical protein [Candidatus Dormibacteraeota bacterium]